MLALLLMANRASPAGRNRTQVQALATQARTRLEAHSMARHCTSASPLSGSGAARRRRVRAPRSLFPRCRCREVGFLPRAALDDAEVPGFSPQASGSRQASSSRYSCWNTLHARPAQPALLRQDVVGVKDFRLTSATALSKEQARAAVAASFLPLLFSLSPMVL